MIDSAAVLLSAGWLVLAYLSDSSMKLVRARGPSMFIILISMIQVLARFSVPLFVTLVQVLAGVCCGLMHTRVLLIFCG